MCASSFIRSVAFGASTGFVAMGSTFAGGGGGDFPKMASLSHTPRCTGRCRVPSEVSERIAACVSRPPRRLSAGSDPYQTAVGRKRAQHGALSADQAHGRLQRVRQRRG